MELKNEELLHQGSRVQFHFYNQVGCGQMSCLPKPEDHRSYRRREKPQVNRENLKFDFSKLEFLK
jgi:hypothetical protein